MEDKSMAEMEYFKAERGQRPGANQDARLDWWRAAKFGMFIHWGVYSIPAGVWKGQHIPGIGEWIMLRAEIPIAEYEQLATQFNPVNYDADAIVKLAKAAGQKYIVLTSKHHDGFCLYDSAETGYNIVDGSPFGRDALGELAAACAREGIRLGLYYSQTQDWHHPNGYGNAWDFDEAQQDFGDYIDNYVKPQVREILSNYGPIALIWFDTPRIISRQQSQELLELVHRLQPECLVCGRLGNQLGDYATAQDNAIPPDLQAEIDWETPATINDTWGFKTHDHNWKSTAQLLRNLVDIVSKGGNYLLNIGPDATGAVPEPSAQRLQEMGAWLDAHSEAIYCTQPGPVQGIECCRTTQKDGAIYLHVFDWPASGRLVLPRLDASSAEWLDPSVDAPLTLNQGDGKTVILGPAVAPNAHVSVIKLTK
ncbi:MAG: alpha-L-fucosidase [Chloroflexi bacterium]|nr:alpha-L-fucosidase [Chloroflexota bacterium]